MAFRRTTEVKHVEPVIDMSRLAQDLDKEAERQREVAKYAPPSLRSALLMTEEPVVSQITTQIVSEVTKEIDEILSSAKEEIGRLESDAQAVRDMYHKHMAHIIEEAKRLQEGVRLSLKTMETLREQCAQLDMPRLEAPKPEEPPQ